MGVYVPPSPRPWDVPEDDGKLDYVQTIARRRRPGICERLMGALGPSACILTVLGVAELLVSHCLVAGQSELLPSMLIAVIGLGTPGG